MKTGRIRIRVILCSVLFIFALIITSVHSVEVVSPIAISSEAVLSELLTSGVLSYYERKPFETFGYTTLKLAFEATPSRDFGINALYMGMVAENVYLFGSLLGHKGSLGLALSGAYAPAIASYIITDLFTLSSSKAASGARFGTAFAPVTSAMAYHWSKSLDGFGENRENADFMIAQISGSYYSMALANIGLERLSIGLRSQPKPEGALRFLSATSLGMTGGLSAYGIGELRGSGDGSLHGTLLSGFATSAIGASAGALVNNEDTGGSYWLDGHYWGTVIFTDTAAPVGHRLFQPEKEYSKLAQVIGGYYGSAIAGSSMDLLSRKRIISDKRFAVLRATTMSLASGFAAYGVGDHWGESDGKLGRTLLGSLSSPVSGFLLTSYVGVPEGYDEMYRVASFFSPITAMLGYHFPSEDFRASEDNNRVFSAEIFAGYLGGGVAALGLNHTGCDLGKAWSDWKLALIRSTVLPLACACTVYALGEKYGSGQGAFVDSLIGSFIAPAGFGALPVVSGTLVYGLMQSGYMDSEDFLSAVSAWDEAALIGTFLSPVFAAYFYKNGADSADSDKNASSNSSKAAPPHWEVVFPMSQVRF